MTTPNADDAWRRLTAAARTSSPADEPAHPPEGLADRVLAQTRRHGPVRRGEFANERVLEWSAAIALAASLLLTVASWRDLSSVLSPKPSPFEELVTWELLP